MKRPASQSLKQKKLIPNFRPIQQDERIATAQQLYDFRQTLISNQQSRSRESRCPQLQKHRSQNFKTPITPVTPVNLSRQNLSKKLLNFMDIKYNSALQKSSDKNYDLFGEDISFIGLKCDENDESFQNIRDIFRQSEYKLNVVKRQDMIVQAYNQPIVARKASMYSSERAIRSSIKTMQYQTHKSLK